MGMTDINWTAIDNAIKYYNYHYRKWRVDSNNNHIPYGSYQTWMLEENGIDHTETYIRIVDEQLYLMFLLRWS